MKVINKWLIVDHGVHHEQHWQGDGVGGERERLSNSFYDACYKGCGQSFRDALNCAANDLADDYDLPLPLSLEQEIMDASDRVTVDEDSDEIYHYAVIKVGWIDR